MVTTLTDLNSPPASELNELDPFHAVAGANTDEVAITIAGSSNALDDGTNGSDDVDAPPEPLVLFKYRKFLYNHEMNKDPRVKWCPKVCAG